MSNAKSVISVTNNVFVIPELYGISIVIKTLPGEIHSMTTQRGWWIRNKANELIERERNNQIKNVNTLLFHPVTEVPYPNIVCESFKRAVRFSYFWVNYTRCGSKYDSIIMKEIETTRYTVENNK